MLSKLIDFSGKVVLITGAGSGIGRATAQLFAEAGARLALTELPGRGNLLNQQIAEYKAQGCDADSWALDLCQSLTIERVVEQVADRYGRIDVLINNAGMQILKPTLELEEAEFDQLINVNLKGAFLMAQAAGRLMTEQQSGCIINVASQHAVVGNIDRAAYCASKGGLVALSRALAVEWAPFGIRVNAVSPTFVQNEHNQQILQREDIANAIKHGVLLGRAARTDEIAAGILYLASPAAAMVTGHNLLIDGGWTCQ